MFFQKVKLSILYVIFWSSNSIFQQFCGWILSRPPLVNDFYCIFKKEFFKHFLKQFIFHLSITKCHWKFLELTVFLLQKVKFLHFIDISCLNSICSLILLIKFTHTPHMNTFYCNFDKHFFKMANILSFFLSIFGITFLL